MTRSRPGGAMRKRSRPEKGRRRRNVGREVQEELKRLLCSPAGWSSWLPSLAVSSLMRGGGGRSKTTPREELGRLVTTVICTASEENKVIYLITLSSWSCNGSTLYNHGGSWVFFLSCTSIALHKVSLFYKCMQVRYAKMQKVPEINK